MRPMESLGLPPVTDEVPFLALEIGEEFYFPERPWRYVKADDRHARVLDQNGAQVSMLIDVSPAFKVWKRIEL